MPWVQFWAEINALNFCQISHEIQSIQNAAWPVWQRAIEWTAPPEEMARENN